MFAPPSGCAQRSMQSICIHEPARSHPEACKPPISLLAIMKLENNTSCHLSACYIFATSLLHLCTLLHLCLSVTFMCNIFFHLSYIFSNERFTSVKLVTSLWISVTSFPCLSLMLHTMPTHTIRPLLHMYTYMLHLCLACYMFKIILMCLLRIF